ncbi:alkaline phosphatase [Coraliomargarita akajimensis]|uniref:Alkaline phosphatase n=1 Tax=Coraliomargarita akajimensis (strain DSM 45221 / IAM 15411 / JCM 23193 / KCTC 12865 / 04OKA010-24) TaxID=583355 RepID=D5EQV3_CORAD|nr:alkaline phosphatase [Coraliomargarita akajimensis]ADE53946.1 Alkaline phosphatase [Coraliomargarita akajimensis DSM 45221]
MSTKSVASRREFLKGVGLLGASATVIGHQAVAVSPQKPQSLGKAKNLIFLVADGMGTGTLSLANHWKLRAKGEPLHWMQLYNTPGFHSSFQNTASASSPVTDSAAAASAWGSGQRVNNRSLNTSVDGQPLVPLYDYAKKAGKKTGLVSTCKVTHATPAGFAASVLHRDMEDAIALQYLEKGIDCMLGGGRHHFQREAVPHLLPQLAKEAVDLLPQFKAKGYQIVENRTGLEQVVPGKPLLGLFAGGHIPYALDRNNDSGFQHVPSLPEMFTAALKQLDGAPKGFVLQVEGGRVDHAGHANDPACILQEQLEFDDCIPLALEFIATHPDTLLIVTTDHGTGGCQLNGYGMNYNGTGAALDRINQFTASFDTLAYRFKTRGNFDTVQFQQATGIKANLDQADRIQAAIDTNIPNLNSVMTDTFRDELMGISAVGWTSNNHTAENVELLAAGPGAEAIPGLIDNNQLFGYMRQALGI